MGAVMSGALAFSALALPAVAQADERPGATLIAPFSAKSPADEGVGNTTIGSVSVNGGSDIVLGTTAKKKITVTVTATDDSGINDAAIALWHGPDIDHADGALIPNEDIAACVPSTVDPTTSTCKLTITVDPQADLYMNALAGTWKVLAGAQGKDGDYVVKDAYSTAKVKRAARLTVNATPEPVKKGKTITVTGKLTRANWETISYKGYSTQPVVLQFRKKGSDVYTNVKGVKTSTTGTLKTTTTATVDGYYRFVYAGSATTGPIKATGDFVDVK
jgi:hypothetical protein